jgi:hypothetical protein
LVAVATPAILNTIIGGACNDISSSTASSCANVLGGYLMNVTRRSCSAAFGYDNTTTNCSFTFGCIQSAFVSSASFYYIVKNVNNFKIPHVNPQKSNTHEMFHTSVEAPSRGENIYRHEITTIGCNATLQLPDYHRHLNTNEQIWVTPKDHMGSAYGILNQDRTCVEFTSNCDGAYLVLIIATRNDCVSYKTWVGAERLIPQRDAI